MKQQKIDIHCHTSKRQLFNTVSSDATIKEIEQQMRSNDIQKTVLLATYFPYKGTGVSNYRMKSWIERKNNFLMFGSLDMEGYFLQGMNELEELASEQEIHGIKIYTGYQNIQLHDNKMRELLGLAQDQLLPIAFHTGYSHGAMRTIGKPSFADFVKPSDVAMATKNYDIPIIICHMGKPFTDDLIETVRKNENIITDMSGLLASKYEQELIPKSIEEIKRFLGECGPSRLLFGTDFPVQTHEHSIYMLDQALQGYSHQDKDLVYYQNAKKILKLK